MKKIIVLALMLYGYGSIGSQPAELKRDLVFDLESADLVKIHLDCSYDNDCDDFI